MADSPTSVRCFSQLRKPLELISSPGQSLDSSVQRAMEERMGDSFGDVQIHADPRAAEAAEQLNARAFTVGNHIAFNHGEYDPSSAEGQHVLAHELAHVRQQTGGALSMLPQEDVALEIDPDPELEREAEETAERVMAGGKLDIAAESRDLATAHDVELDELTETPVTDLTDEETRRWESFVDDLTDLVRETETDLSDSLYVDSVSSLYAGYVDGPEYEENQPDRDPFDREPDAVIELPPVELREFDRFRTFLDHHLKCQVRDTFVRMGVEPPEEFRVVGHGRLASVVAYKFIDLYPDYHDPNALESS